MSNKKRIIENAVGVLTSLKRDHHYCEDSWYSCPKAEEGCANEAEGTDCTCGADHANKIIDSTIEQLESLL